MPDPQSADDRQEADSVSKSSGDPESWDERPDTDWDTEQRYARERPPHHGD
ncbi:MAG: hypothetical protein WCP28_13030 [Actinomycetes bacterium]